ncbi:hypothetical protein [Aphanothece sacrum]|uniref:Papain family cysteine protease containing protein n=1 Tax=Aphanothece sacrum FPU1 TaxID=1920663 RepID=A0A401IMZ2_APHSA|nr:hypothetical protein [Aphanothece sacrum]GBF82606.1 Papain family cysteine protease containing protein [Aphanothece sacrum FPU1]GBF84740.1 papain family cysteine protease containing protein [Aphanothece sacrum FPU3]
MTTQLIELEGSWEEILKQADKFIGHRVRVIILTTEAEIKQAITIESQKELDKLNSNYLIGGNENIRFGDLSQEEQESIKQALVSQTEGKLERWKCK